jgi:GTP cyclohydrolase I
MTPPFVPSEDTTQAIAQHVEQLLIHMGEDPTREGLVRTPHRVGEAMQFLTQGYQQDPEAILRAALFEEDYRQMVVVKDITFYSLCEHHLLPFFGKVHIAYIPDGKVVGLSKLARTVEVFARRLQIQEQMTGQIADAIMTHMQPKGVMVMVEAEHMCMTMRGIKKPGSQTITLARRGDFETNPALEDRFFRMLGK